jgi:hypothetical protein
MIGSHLALSDFICAMSSAGVPPSGSMLSFAKASRSSGFSRPSLIAALSLAMIGAGVGA